MKTPWTFVGICLVVHVLLLIDSIYHHFPNVDEIAHLPSGVAHWKYQRFDMYRVNPPLVRLAAGLPAWTANIEYDWEKYSDATGTRPEFAIGRERLIERGLKIHGDFVWPRVFCLIFSIVGCVTLVHWVNRLLGTVPAMFACVYWCFSPDILANAPTIVPDVGMISMGVISCYSFWRYVRDPSMTSCAFAGFCLGLALLSKLTWISAFVSLPFSLAVCIFVFRDAIPYRGIYRRLGDICVFWIVAIFTLDSGYLFENVFCPLGQFEFCSEALGGKGSSPDELGNRFAGTVLAFAPVPFPKNYVLGIDYLRYEVETKSWSFLMGEWKLGSWPYYYLLTALWKTPLCTLIAFTIAIGSLCFRKVRAGLGVEVMSALFVLGLPALLNFLLVSAQGGFNHHHRYVLFVYPPIFVISALLVSKPVLKAVFMEKRLGSLGKAKSMLWRPRHYLGPSLLLFFSVLPVLLVYPHFGTYFNSLAGGPRNGWRLLGFSNIEWGQDILFVSDWIKNNPECRPILFELDHFSNSGNLFGLPRASPPLLPRGASASSIRPTHSQWWIVSVKRLYNRPGEPGLEYLQELTPVDRIGFSYFIYRVEPKQ